MGTCRTPTQQCSARLHRREQRPYLCSTDCPRPKARVDEALWTGLREGDSLIGEDTTMATALAKNLEDAIQRLRHDPVHPVQAIVGDLRVEIRVKAPRSAAD